MNKFKRLTSTLPAYYKAEVQTYLGGLLHAWGVSDDQVTAQIVQAKNQLFIQTAEGRYLDRDASNYGVERSAQLGVDDSDFRKLTPILSTYPKQVRSTLVSLFDVFWGPGFTRANVNSGNNEVYNFGAPQALIGTLAFTKGMKTVIGSGTSFLAQLQVGDYIRPANMNDKAMVRVARVVGNAELELSFEWEKPSIALIGGAYATALTLSYNADRTGERTIRFSPNAFTDLTSITAKELVTFINQSPEHSQYIEGDEYFDPLSGNKLNIRTKTPGLQGSVQVTGGTANSPGMLNFPLVEAHEIKAAVYELNPNEVVVQIPSSVPILRRSLRGSVHPKKVKTIITSVNEPFNFSAIGSNSALTINVDGSPYVVTFNHVTDFQDSTKVLAHEVALVINRQLDFLESFTDEPEAFKSVGLRTTEGSSEYQVTGGSANTILQFTNAIELDPDTIIAAYPSAYLFDPTGTLYTVTGTNATLTQDIGQGSVLTTVSLNDASSFPNTSGLILFNFGRKEQEGPIRYNSRPNNSTLLIDASHIFQKNHLAGRYVNVVSDKPTLPRVTGEDYPVYIVGTEEARAAAQTLIQKLIAAGVIIRFVIKFPEVLFEVKISVPDKADQFGTLTTQATPPFLTP